MTDRPGFEPRRFQSTVPYYLRYRLNYPELLLTRVVALTGLQPSGRVLDLGCGPGLLALGFARLGMAVTAMDPEPEMIDAVGAAAAEAGLPISACAGSSYDLPTGLEPFDLVAMGRSFHWMDRARTLDLLDGMINPGGAIVLFNDEHLKTSENRWRQVLDSVADRYGADKAPHRAARKDPAYRCHRSILLESRFNRIESAGVMVERTLSVDDIVGYARSLSVTATRTLGERAEAFEAELRRELAALSPEGTFRELAEMRAVIARRP